MFGSVDDKEPSSGPLKGIAIYVLFWSTQISDSTPLVSEQLPITCLNAEYLGDEVFTSKIQDLAGKYKFLRRTRPDGNCFFRAFAYAYLEHLMSNKDEYLRFKELAEKSKDKLVQLGFPSFTLEDFHDTVRAYIYIYIVLFAVTKINYLHFFTVYGSC